ncbi:hypothetical protein V1Y59_02775 [Gordonia sp. PKS22-38]|uniref:Uncharacterized protein n=1 Tax=Gordonia prachuapensis TaxID=3115651 RepID=A0ABU7MNT4_9ACTN|nr:hypothetical protein [Gordonia sp. PKS22-38]
MGSGRRQALSRRLVVTAAATLAAAGMAVPGQASAAPVGKVDAGVPFSSIVYGTGCLYELTVDVNSSGAVTFWERPRGGPARVIGVAPAYGAIATTKWVPRRIATTELYATQNGATGPIAVFPVHQGYGSGWACFAL